jgi:hypothetical protein
MMRVKDVDGEGLRYRVYVDANVADIPNETIKRVLNAYLAAQEVSGKPCATSELQAGDLVIWNSGSNGLAVQVVTQCSFGSKAIARWPRLSDWPDISTPEAREKLIAEVKAKMTPKVTGYRVIKAWPGIPEGRIGTLMVTISDYPACLDGICLGRDAVDWAVRSGYLIPVYEDAP